VEVTESGNHDKAKNNALKSFIVQATEEQKQKDRQAAEQ
jgi:hypothetical protein